MQRAQKPPDEYALPYIGTFDRKQSIIGLRREGEQHQSAVINATSRVPNVYSTKNLKKFGQVRFMQEKSAQLGKDRH